MPTQPLHWSDPYPPPPTMSWAQLETVLCNLSIHPQAPRLVRDHLLAIAKTAKFKPPTMVEIELRLLTWAALDEADRLTPRTPINAQTARFRTGTDGEGPMS